MNTNEKRLDIANRLKEEPNLKGYDLQVNIQGERVVLQGVVDTLSEKQLASKVAGGAGLHVENAITISTDGTAIDKNIQFEVSEELNADPNVQLKHIGADVRNGTARLVGHADSEQEVQAAQNAASKSRGVKRVLNQVEVDKEHGRTEPPRNAEEAKKRGLDS